jgi:hypothetical protein
VPGDPGEAAGRLARVEIERQGGDVGRGQAEIGEAVRLEPAQFGQPFGGAAVAGEGLDEIAQAEAQALGEGGGEVGAAEGDFEGGFTHGMALPFAEDASSGVVGGFDGGERRLVIASCAATIDQTNEKK